MNAVDTNVLIYATGSDDPARGRMAVELLHRLSTEQTKTVLLWQVLCEFTSYVVKASRRNDTLPQSLQYVEAIRDRFEVVVPSKDLSALAMEIHVNDQVSIWDSFLIAACIDSGVTQLFTEDLQSKPVIRGVRVVDPFAAQ